MNSLLSKHRGLSDEQRLSAFIAECESIEDLPHGLKPPNGDTDNWSDESCSLWADAYQEISSRGKLGSCTLPVPGDSVLIVDDDGEISLDGMILRNLPLLDIALWLSNPQRVDVVSDWRTMILGLACACRTAWNLNGESWAQWMMNNSWTGIEIPSLGVGENCAGDIQPFFEFIGLQCEEEVEDRRYLGIVARKNSEIIHSTGGLAAKSWAKILESEPESISELFNMVVSPRLVIIDNQLSLLILKDGRPEPLRVTVNPVIWRTLVAWTLEPPETVGANRLSYIFWCWNGENEDWMPSERQILSARMLRGAIESLGDDSSLETLTYTENTSGLFVRGRSGLVYVIVAMGGVSRFMVEALPDVDSVDRAFSQGMLVCIDEEGESSLPAGDVAVSYLLSLRDDIESRKMIHTLDALLSAVEHTERKEDETPSEWWSRVSDNYGDWMEGFEEPPEVDIPEGFDEYHDQNAELEELLYDAEPDFDFELPPPGDYDALAEALENAAMQARQLQGGAE